MKDTKDCSTIDRDDSSDEDGKQRVINAKIGSFVKKGFNRSYSSEL